MPKDNVLSLREQDTGHGQSHEEAQSLLSSAANDEGADVATQADHLPHRIAIGSRRQSSLVRQPENGAPRTPRTANRVHFDIEERRSSEHAANGHAPDALGWIDEDDYLSHHAAGRGRSDTGQRAPLLTDIEAPSVTVASAGDGFNAEDYLENARPRSGMGSAFMNMANSIM